MTGQRDQGQGRPDRPGQGRPDRPGGRPDVGSGHFGSGKLPTSCTHIGCCEGELCFERTFGNRSIAFCAQEDSEGNRPPRPPPITCSQLECGQNFTCRMREGRRGPHAVCLSPRAMLQPTEGNVRPGRPDGSPSGSQPPTGRPDGRPSGSQPPTGRPDGSPSGSQPPTGRPDGRPSGSQPPTGRPDGSPSGSQPPTGRPDGRPSGSQPPTGRPDGSPSGSQPPTGRPDGRPNGSQPLTGSRSG